jgi:hypothetical protein
MLIAGILRKLKGKKLDVFVRNLGEYSCFQGVLTYMNEEVIVLRAKYNNSIYIPISEIVIVTEHDMKTDSFRAKLKDRIMRDTVVNSLKKQQ